MPSPTPFDQAAFAELVLGASASALDLLGLVVMTVLLVGGVLVAMSVARLLVAIGE